MTTDRFQILSVVILVKVEELVEWKRICGFVDGMDEGKGFA
jgi:hypothetical protein